MTWIPAEPQEQNALLGLISHYHPHPEAKLQLALYRHDELIYTQALYSEHEIKVGASRDCDLELEHDAHVDSQHLVLTRNAQGWSCQDLHSRHGSYINGRRFYDSVPVRPMDELGLGSYVIRLLDESIEPGPLRVGPPRAQPIYLQVYEDQRPLHQHAIQGKTRLSIGRQIDNDIQLPGALVSRQHAELTYSRGSWWVRDCGSFNGTRINEQRIKQSTRLSDGDRVGIGSYELEFKRTKGTSAEAISKALEEVDRLQADMRQVPGTRQIHGDPLELSVAERPFASPNELTLGKDAAPKALRGPKLPYTLRIKSPDTPVTLFRSASAELSIGRSSDCDIILQEEYVSRRHARINLTDTGLFVSPLKEHTKVYVNGRRLDGPHRLAPGERVFVGAYELILLPDRPKEPHLMIPLIDIMLCTPQGQWSRHAFAQPSITIGRMPQCDLELNDIKASRLHAELIVRRDKIVLRDNESTNGVEVNDSAVYRERVVVPGDMIKIGNHILYMDRKVSWRPKAANDDQPKTR